MLYPLYRFSLSKLIHFLHNGKLQIYISNWDFTVNSDLYIQKHAEYLVTPRRSAIPQTHHTLPGYYSNIHSTFLAGTLKGTFVSFFSFASHIQEVSKSCQIIPINIFLIFVLSISTAFILSQSFFSSGLATIIWSLFLLSSLSSEWSKWYV